MSSEENIIVASVSVLRNGEVFMVQEKKASAYDLLDDFRFPQLFIRLMEQRIDGNPPAIHNFIILYS